MKYTMLLIMWFMTGGLLAQKDNYASVWVDSVMSEMTVEQKIGQLFMIRALSNKGKNYEKELISTIKDYHVGGICFFQGSPGHQAELTKTLQQASSIPLMIAMDAEWGLGMRHKEEAISFPRQLTLGAINDNTLVYDMGSAIAEQLNLIGTHVNFAPVADVNNNPANPVIHDRSFGEDIFNVATKSYAYTKGLQDAGVMACAKHFPGHGDTDVDSHYDLPVIKHSRERLDSIEMMPFRVLTQLGVKSMMIGHMSVPALDDRPHRPTSLSREVVTELLKNKINFEGLIFTDALEMKGVTRDFEPGEIELEAIKAGNDVLLLPANIDKAVKHIREEIATGALGLSVVEQKVRRILLAKYNLGLNNYRLPPDSLNIDSLVNRNSYLALKTKLYEKAITLVKDDNKLVPIRDPHLPSYATLALGTDETTAFQSMLSKFGIDQHYFFETEINQRQERELIRDLENVETLIISLHKLNKNESSQFGLSPSQLELLYNLSTTKQIILVNFGSPYALQYFPRIETIIQAYEEDSIMQQATAQALVGVNAFEGRLPVSVHAVFPVKSGIYRPSILRLGYALPESVGISSDSLRHIDTIMEEMIRLKGAPGCQVLAARYGKIFYDKTFGYHTYEEDNPVKATDLYDVASVTKTLATTISLMKMHDEGKFNIHKPLKYYLPESDHTDKGDLILEDILAHHSGLQGWIPFYRETIDPKNKLQLLLPQYYRETPTDSFCVQISEGIYLRNDYRDSIFHKIYSSELIDEKEYVYSDLGYYLLKRIIEKENAMSLDEYVKHSFYRPLNLNNTMFNPLLKIPSERVVPTEQDDYYRCQVIHGHVHDMGAAMMGGVCGHAGLFSNASDLAVLMQMLLNGGSYAGKKYISPGTIRKFTNRYYRSTRRGLGFDMKELDDKKVLNIAAQASDQTFGHLGFTGISVFADPKYDLIYIFLSNRTYPSMENTLFSRKGYRPRVQAVFYKAIMDHYELPELAEK